MSLSVNNRLNYHTPINLWFNNCHTPEYHHKSRSHTPAESHLRPSPGNSSYISDPEILFLNSMTCADSEAVSEKHHCTFTPDSSTFLHFYLKSLFGAPTHPAPRVKTLNVEPLAPYFGFKSEIENLIKPKILKLCPETTRYNPFPSTFYIYTGKNTTKLIRNKKQLLYRRVEWDFRGQPEPFTTEREDDFSQIMCRVKWQGHANLTDVIKHLQTPVCLFCLFMCLYI